MRLLGYLVNLLSNMIYRGVRGRYHNLLNWFLHHIDSLLYWTVLFPHLVNMPRLGNISNSSDYWKRQLFFHANLLLEPNLGRWCYQIRCFFFYHFPRGYSWFFNLIGVIIQEESFRFWALGRNHWCFRYEVSLGCSSDHRYFLWRHSRYSLTVVAHSWY